MATMRHTPRRMLPSLTWTLAEDNASLQGQATGLAEAAGLTPVARMLRPLGIWRHVAPALWPRPLAAIAPDALAPPFADLVIGCGGKAAAVLAALRKRTRTVIVQHPRMDIRKFDLVVVSEHDQLKGPNVLSVRTALHRVTPARLAQAAADWGPAFASLKRPLVAVLVGGSNGRFRMDVPVAEAFAAQLAEMIRRDDVGMMVTPSRRTGAAVREVLERVLKPLGAEIWDMTGDNPYLGMLACADAIVVTGDSVSMVAEAAVTHAPVLLASLPGKSQRIGNFADAMLASGRVRRFAGRLEMWPVQPMDDTAEVAAEMCRRFGY